MFKNYVKLAVNSIACKAFVRKNCVLPESTSFLVGNKGVLLCGANIDGWALEEGGSVVHEFDHL